MSNDKIEDNPGTVTPDTRVVYPTHSVVSSAASHQSLIESERKYRTLFEKSISPMLIIKGNALLDGNQSALNILGLSSLAELRQLTIEDISPATQPNGIPSSFYITKRRDMLREVGTSAYFETYHQRKNGEIFPVAVSVTVVSIDGESIKHAIWQDITDRIKAEKELSDYQAHLEELVKARTRELEVVNKELEAFSYSVSHDLRAPLRAIDGYSQALIEDYGRVLEDAGIGFLQRVRKNAQYMAELIDSLLLLSSLSRIQMQMEKVDMAPLASEILQARIDQAPERVAEIRIHPDLNVHADQGLVTILLENLLANAWKYSSKQSVTTIEFGIKEKSATESIFFICDNGAGFDMRHAGMLFGAFQRLHDAEEFEGTGIGLATVKRIITRHGGRIWAESAVGKGATFYFSFPQLPATGSGLPVDADG